MNEYEKWLKENFSERLLNNEMTAEELYKKVNGENSSTFDYAKALDDDDFDKSIELLKKYGV